MDSEKEASKEKSCGGQGKMGDAAKKFYTRNEQEFHRVIHRIFLIGSSLKA